MNDIIVQENERIESLIYVVRNKQVMLDSDLARLYECVNQTKTINQAVKRNQERFPERFCFQLTKEEYENLKSQFGTSSWDAHGGVRKLPYVFTEQGVAMLATVLRTPIATMISIRIMDAFVSMRKFFSINNNILERITLTESKLIEHDKNFKKVFDALEDKKNLWKEKIFYEGQIFDAYIVFIKLFRKAKKSIVIIDNYIDESILEMLTKKKENVSVTIITSARSSLKEIDIAKFESQYGLIEFSITEDFHDRFLLIDNKVLYHCGASIKDSGKKCFAINKIEEKRIIKMIKESVWG